MMEFIKKEPIDKGWSGDRKYRATAADGTKYLLRVSDISEYDRKKNEFKMLRRVEALGISMCAPVEFGTCEDGVYLVQSWIDGEDLQAALPALPEAEQCALGLRAGEILRRIHSIPAPEGQGDWAFRYNQKLDRYIRNYRACGLRFEGDDVILAYTEQNSRLLKNRPQCFQHGDYHVGNMMLEQGRLVIIDFDRDGYGDPWEDFKGIMFSANISPHFATGQVRGYFGGEPPEAFWALLAFYMAATNLNALPWSIKFGQEEIDFAYKMIGNILRWFDNMRNPVPTWYLKEI